ncbi:MAG TPA: ABC transporter transmembrane domain-containing protein, partial [Gaiellaceae bacterium]
MRVWQPGSHLTMQRGAQVDDWSWARTRRRVAALARLTARYRTRTFLSIFSLLAATATALAPPFLSKYAIDDGIRQHDLQKLWLIVAAFLIAGLANWGMSYVQTYLTGWVGERILADLRIMLFRHLQRLSLGFYERTRAGVIISRLTNDVEALDQLVTDGVTTLVQSTLTLVGTAILLFVLDWRLALATLAVIPIMSVGTILFRVRSSRAYAAVRERLGLVTATLAEDIAGMRMVQAFTREDRNVAHFREVAERYRESNLQTVVLNAVYFPFVDLLSSVALAVVLGYGGHLYFQGDVTLGTLFAFMLYVQNFFDPVQQLSQLYNTFLSATAALDKIMDVLDEEPEVLDKPTAFELPEVEGEVEFDDVRFGYGNGPDVLHGLDLEVPAGTTVALVGHTGAGKSTIAKLLARFYDPRGGRITIDGID